MSETLGQKQRRFVLLIGELIGWAYANGYELTFAEAYRTPEQAAHNARTGAGISNSLHLIRLAIDLNLFKNGVYQATSEAHRPLGEYWESIAPDCRWGGRFGDGNHYFHRAQRNQMGILTFIPLIGKVLDRVLPDKAASEAAKLKLLELSQAGDLAVLNAELELAKGQMEINKAEAASRPYAANWRPTVGYIGCFGLAYAVFLRPLLPWTLRALGVEGIEPMPELDTNVLMTILVGMLGIGGYRTFEKTKGVAN